MKLKTKRYTFLLVSDVGVEESCFHLFQYISFNFFSCYHIVLETQIDWCIKSSICLFIYLSPIVSFYKLLCENMPYNKVIISCRTHKAMSSASCSWQ